MSKRYAGLTERTRSAIKGSPECEEAIRTIVDNGGKISNDLCARGGKTRLIFCPKSGNGTRSSLEIGPGDPVPVNLIKRRLRKSGAQPSGVGA